MCVCVGVCVCVCVYLSERQNSFIQQYFIKHLLCAKNILDPSGYSTKPESKSAWTQ